MSILNAFLLLLLTGSGNAYDQVVRNIEFLHRIIVEGLLVDKTTTDLIFMNFKLPEFVDLLDSLLQRLHQSLLVPCFIDARSRHGRTRQIIVVATPDHQTLEHLYIKYFGRQSVPANEQLENSSNKHVIVVTTNFKELRSIFAHTVGYLKTFNFIVLVYSQTVGHVLTLGKGRYIRTSKWNATFSTLLANRRYEFHPKPYAFGAILRTPWVVSQDGRIDGLDVTVFKTIMNHIGQAYKIIIVETGNITATVDTIEDMFYKAEIAAYINRQGFPSEYAVEMMIPHTDGLCLMVPKTQSLYLFHHLLQPYELQSWIFFCCFLFVIGVISSIWHKLFHQNIILTLFCGASLSEHRMRRFERFLTVGSSCLLTVLFEAYLVKFITHMTTYRFVRDPTTIDQYLKSPGKLLVHELVVNATLEIRKDLDRKIVTTPSMTYDITNLTYGYVLKCSSAKTMLVERAEYDQQTFGHNVRPPFHLISEKLEVFHSHYSFASDEMCYTYFKRYFNWLFDSGLIDYWEKNAEQKYSFPPGYELTESVLLDLESLQLVWVVFGIGIAISSVVLLLELILGAIVAWVSEDIVLSSFNLI
uniref:ionotropic receptor 155 precursor n=1 Tax=Aedes aegypti TaxID=7159 RepID=UPI000C2878CF|nr:ionotropic receptor 155 precursor [Aedes aegypti]